LLKQANQLLGQIDEVVFFAAMGITPLVILVLGIVNFRRDRLHQAKSALQALAAMVIWACLTFTLIMIFIMVTFRFPAYVSQANELKGTAIFIVGSLIYVVAGGALIYWTKRQTKPWPAAGVSC
jgi:uncharacterized membrane protein